jgi:hypothetical protein
MFQWCGACEQQPERRRSNPSSFGAWVLADRSGSGSKVLVEQNVVIVHDAGDIVADHTLQNFIVAAPKTLVY